MSENLLIYEGNMYAENHLTFNDDLVSRTGFYLWMHSPKCKYIRIGFYIAMAVSAILTVVGLVRTLIIHTDLTMMLGFLGLTAILFGTIVLIWPLVYRGKAISQIHPEVDQIITMDEKNVNLHTSMSHQKYSWNHFNDIEEDEGYYFLFSPDVYIILDKKRFNKGGEEAFLSHRATERLLKNAKRKSKNARYLIIFANDYLTPLVRFFKK